MFVGLSTIFGWARGNNLKYKMISLKPGAIKSAWLGHLQNACRTFRLIYFVQLPLLCKPCRPQHIIVVPKSKRPTVVIVAVLVNSRYDCWIFTLFRQESESVKVGVREAVRSPKRVHSEQRCSIFVSEEDLLPRSRAFISFRSFTYCCTIVT